MYFIKEAMTLLEFNFIQANNHDQIMDLFCAKWNIVTNSVCWILFQGSNILSVCSSSGFSYWYQKSHIYTPNPIPNPSYFFSYCYLFGKSRCKVLLVSNSWSWLSSTMAGTKAVSLCHHEFYRSSKISNIYFVNELTGQSPIL